MNFQSRDSQSSPYSNPTIFWNLKTKCLQKIFLLSASHLITFLLLYLKFTFCSDFHNCHTVSSTADKIFKSSYTTDSYGNTPILDHAHSIAIKITFSFLKYVLACKNSARFIHSLKLESHVHFWPEPPKDY